MDNTITPVVWAMAPEWIDLDHASNLLGNGHNMATVTALARIGAIDMEDGQVSTDSLLEYLEALFDVGQCD